MRGLPVISSSLIPVIGMWVSRWSALLPNTMGPIRQSVSYLLMEIQWSLVSYLFVGFFRSHVNMSSVLIIVVSIFVQHCMWLPIMQITFWLLNGNTHIQYIHAYFFGSNHHWIAILLLWQSLLVVSYPMQYMWIVWAGVNSWTHSELLNFC